MEAIVKPDCRWFSITSCGGREFIQSEWRKVPAGAEVEAWANPYLDVRDRLGIIPFEEEPQSAYEARLRDALQLEIEYEARMRAEAARAAADKSAAETAAREAEEAAMAAAKSKPELPAAEEPVPEADQIGPVVEPAAAEDKAAEVTITPADGIDDAEASGAGRALAQRGAEKGSKGKGKSK